MHGELDDGEDIGRFMSQERYAPIFSDNRKTGILDFNESDTL